MRKFFPALLGCSLLLGSCAPQNIHCIVHNQSSRPLRMIEFHCKPKAPALITVFIKSDKRNRYSYDEISLPPGDTLHIDKNYHDGYGKVQEISVFRESSTDTLEKTNGTIGTMVIDVTDQGSGKYVSFRKNKK